MKKKPLLVLLLLLCGGMARGQETNLNSNESFKHHEIGFSIGIHPIGEDIWRPARIMMPISENFWRPASLFAYYEPDFFHYRTSLESYSQSFKVGAFNLHYFYNITRKHSVGAVISTTLLNVIIPRSEKNYKGINTYITLNATYRFTYKSFPNIDFYLGVGLGATFGIEAKEINEFVRTVWDNDKWTRRFFVGPSVQLTLLGMRVGKANSANIELGFGPEGILEVGYSYKF